VPARQGRGHGDAPATSSAAGRSTAAERGGSHAHGPPDAAAAAAVAAAATAVAAGAAADQASHDGVGRVGQPGSAAARPGPGPATPHDPGPRDAARRDPAAVRAFIERFTGHLAQAGFPRTPARIFVALLTSDSSTLTAAELGDLLQTSPASVSSGVRYLLQVGLVSAEGERGSRRLHYRMSTAIWQDVVRLRDRQFTHWAAELRTGVQVLGPASPAGTRMAETVRYFEFISREMAGLLARWQIGPSGAGSDAATGSYSDGTGLPAARGRCYD